MEFMPTDLRKLLATANQRHVNDREVGFEEVDVIKILFNMLRTVDFVHSKGLMHRDIKPANFLIDETLQVKICDFGAARPVIKAENPMPSIYSSL